FASAKSTGTSVDNRSGAADLGVGATGSMITRARPFAVRMTLLGTPVIVSKGRSHRSGTAMDMTSSPPKTAKPHRLQHGLHRTAFTGWSVTRVSVGVKHRNNVGFDAGVQQLRGLSD